MVSVLNSTSNFYRKQLKENDFYHLIKEILIVPYVVIAPFRFDFLKLHFS